VFVILTMQDTFKIVTNCIRKLTGVQEVLQEQRLSDLGIDSPDKRQIFANEIVNDFSQAGYKIAANSRYFDQDPTVGDVCSLIAMSATTLAETRTSSVGQRLADKKKTTPAKSGPAKKRAGKKKSTKRYKRGGGSGGWGSYSRGAGHLGGAPSKGAGKKKSALKKPRKESVSNDTVRPSAGKRLVVKGRRRAAKKGGIKKKAAKKKSAKRYKSGGGGSYGGVKADGGGPPPKRAGGKKKKAPARAPKAVSPEATIRVVECTPQLEIKKEIMAAKVYRMAVFVDQGPVAQGADVQQLKIEIPHDMQQFRVDVWLDCSSHFSVDEIADPPQITVKTATGISDELSFTLKVLKAPDDRPMFVSAFFRYNGRPCGKITRYLELANGSLRWKEFVQSGETEGEVALPKADAPPSVVVETQAKPAEIRIEVLQTALKDGKNYTLKCDTPQQDSWKGLWILPEVTKVLVNTYMQGFMANKGSARIASLEGAGLAFWDLLPQEVKGLLWGALEKGASTMSVISQEPYIPWELMVPYRKVRNPRKPLGVDLQLGRWITGDYKSAPQRIPMKNAYIICPKTSGLASAGQEVTFLTQLKPEFDPVNQVTPATFEGIDEGLGGPPRNVIHFICHGRSAVLQTLELDKPDTLDCSQVRTLKGFQAAFKDGPLAFLNACQVGGQVPALDGLGGFANSFIDLGASAVIAPLWSVQDEAALDVTQTFYRQALKGVPFAKIMKEIRAKAYTQTIDTYAAYCFYGDPMASTT
jgi:hypothetical protein